MGFTQKKLELKQRQMKNLTKEEYSVIVKEALNKILLRTDCFEVNMSQWARMCWAKNVLSNEEYAEVRFFLDTTLDIEQERKWARNHLDPIYFWLKSEIEKL